MVFLPLQYMYIIQCNIFPITKTYYGLQVCQCCLPTTSALEHYSRLYDQKLAGSATIHVCNSYIHAGNNACEWMQRGCVYIATF